MPQSWNRSASASVEIGSCFLSQVIMMTMNDRAAPPLFTIIMTPYSVENQCGSVDMIQSKDAKVMVRAKITTPGPQTLRILSSSLGSPDVSWAFDHLISRNEAMIQMAK